MTWVGRLLRISLPSLGAAAVAALGVWAGFYLAQSRFSGYLDRYEQGETLGGLLRDQSITADLSDLQRTEIFRAYSSAADVERRADEISWSVASVPTPFVGNAPRPGRQHNADINSLQFRAKRDLLLPKPPERVRIFLTGGSTAFGAGAPSQEQTIGAYLEGLLNEAVGAGDRRHFEVFTYANPAWASTHERIAIENRLSEWAPDLVISFSGNNDVFWGAAGRDVFWFRAHADDAFWSLLDTVYRLTGRPPIPDVVTIVPEPVAPSLVAERLEKNVRLGSYALALQDVDFLFVLQPTLAVTRKPLTRREREFLDAQEGYYAASYRTIDERLSALQDPNFRYINLSGVFDGMAAAEDIFLDSFHFGDKGNRLIAQALAEALWRLYPWLKGQQCNQEEMLAPPAGNIKPGCR